MKQTNQQQHDSRSALRRFCSGLTSIEHIPVSLELMDSSHPGRKPVEQFIQEIYSRYFSASIQQLMPTLLSLKAHNGQLLAALGIRGASSEALFLENYLDTSIEENLSAVAGQAIKRDDIVEIGNLAAFNSGAARWVLIALTAYLYALGYKWVTFTALPSLYNSFRRLGLAPVKLADADINCIPEEQHSYWGNYYDKQPVVYGGDISRGYDSLCAFIEPDMREHWEYWQQLAHEKVVLSKHKKV